MLRVRAEGELKETNRFALLFQGERGAKADWIVQVAAGARVLPEQVSALRVNIEASLPVLLTVFIVRDAVPAFVIIKVCAVDVVLTSMLPKSFEGGVAVVI